MVKLCVDIISAEHPVYFIMWSPIIYFSWIVENIIHYNVCHIWILYDIAFLQENTSKIAHFLL